MRRASTSQRLRDHPVEPEASDRSFGLLVGVVLLLAAVAPLWRRGTVRWWAAGLAALFLLASWLVPAGLRPAKRAWLFLGSLLGAIVNPLILGLLFFLLMAPVGLLMRAFGRDALRLGWDSKAATYWQTRRETSSDLHHQF